MSLKHASFSGKRNSKGFTLLEVLIAMLVLSIGLLGIAGLQATSLQYSLDATGRGKVTILAEDILNKIRMQTGIVTGDDVPGVIAEYAVAAPASPACDPLAGGPVAELNCWHAAVADQLPEGQAQITAIGGRQIQIRIQWYEQGSRGYVADEGSAAGSVLKEGTRFFTIVANM